MTPEQHADALIERCGIPTDRELLHAMLCMMHAQGKVDGAMEIGGALKEKFAQQAQQS